MKISLIENGLDSLKKGYKHLEEYEKLLDGGAEERARFSALKDSVLSIQHGVEILFKYALKEHNELLLYGEISKLKAAFVTRREGKIQELYEAEGVHTITFKESVERLKDICGFAMSVKLNKNLSKVEGWRNSITHSAVLLLEHEVANVLVAFLEQLDEFLGPIIGEQYLEGQGRTELDRTYRLTKAVYGDLEDKIKSLTIERLIHVLKENNVKGVTSPGVFLIDEPKVIYSILKGIQGGEVRYGSDFMNYHCSGSTDIRDLSDDGVVTIYTSDNRWFYQFALSAMVVYIPGLANSESPLVFLYSGALNPEGSNPKVSSDGRGTQEGLIFDDGNLENWDAEAVDQSNSERLMESGLLPSHKHVTRFLLEGPVCFLNVQMLSYGHAEVLMHDEKYSSPRALYEAFVAELSK